MDNLIVMIFMKHLSFYSFLNKVAYKSFSYEFSLRFNPRAS